MPQLPSKFWRRFIPKGLRISKNRKSRNPAARIQILVIMMSVKEIAKKVRAWPAHSSLTRHPGSSPYFSSKKEPTHSVIADESTAKTSNSS